MNSSLVQEEKEKQDEVGIEHFKEDIEHIRKDYNTIIRVEADEPWPDDPEDSNFPPPNKKDF